MKKKTDSVEAVVATVSAKPLVEVVESSGVDLSEGKMYAMHFASNMQMVHSVTDEAMSKINFENPTDKDCKMARELRLKLVPNRTDAERKKDNLKKGLLTKTNLIQGLFNVVKSSSELVEQRLMDVEKKREREEAKRIAELRERRMALLSQFTDESSFPVEHMSEEAFSSLLDAQRAAYEKRVQAEKEAAMREELERQARQRVLDIERKLLPLSQWIEGFNDMDISLLTDLEVDSMLMSAIEAKKIEEEAQREALIAAEKEAERLKELARMAEIERARIQEEAERERKAKQALEEKIRFEQEMREAQRIAEEEAARRAAEAPDWERVKRYAQEIYSVEGPKDLKSEKAIELCRKIKELQTKILLYASDQIKSMK